MTAVSCGVGSLSVMTWLMTDDGSDLTPVIVTLSMIGKFAMTAAFGTEVLFAQEIYPTNIRYVLLRTQTARLLCLLMRLQWPAHSPTYPHRTHQ